MSRISYIFPDESGTFLNGFGERRLEELRDEAERATISVSLHEDETAQQFFAASAVIGDLFPQAAFSIGNGVVRVQAESRESTEIVESVIDKILDWVSTGNLDADSMTRAAYDVWEEAELDCVLREDGQEYYED